MASAQLNKLGERENDNCCLINLQLLRQFGAVKLRWKMPMKKPN